MKPTIFVTLFFNFSFLAYAQTAEQSKAIDNYVKKVIQINEIPGMAYSSLLCFQCRWNAG